MNVLKSENDIFNNSKTMKTTFTGTVPRNEA